MRQILVFFALMSICLCGGRLPAQVPYPYEVIVGHKGLDVYAGPEKDSYVTGRLPHGTRVQVYGEEGRGWLAIRPPEDSFSWVRSADVKRSDADPAVASVIRDEAVCRIGSQLDLRKNNVSQVRLKRGEMVEVLGEQELPTRQNGRLVAESWCRIAPPAGEFRYVLSRSLQPPKSSVPLEPHPLVALAGSIGTRLNPFGSPRLWQQPPSPAAAPTVAVAAGAAAAPASTATPLVAAAVPATSTQASPTAAVPASADATFASSSLPATTAAPTGIAPAAESTPPAAATPVATPSANPTAAATAKLPQNLQEMQVAVSAMAAQDVGRWNVDPLRLQLEAIRQQPLSETDQIEADRLQSRLDEFAALHRQAINSGSVAAAPAAPAATDSAAVSPAAAPIVTPAPPSAVASQPVYDGSGWLVPVHSTKQIAPPYALLDAEGNVIQYVSPEPGFNLHRYVRKQVGIYGQRGYIPSLNKQHLTAERIIELDRHVR